MEDSQEKGGNPEIGLQGDSLESAEKAQSNTGSKDFFDALDNEVNGQIIDKPVDKNTEVTQNQQDVGSNNVQTQSDDRTDWEKRYKDSSREAVKWRDRYNEVEKFVPVLDAMKKDSGLVEHVREYLVNGGKPAKSVQDELNLKEDFVFDQHEAMTSPDSDSAKLMNAHVDKMVESRVNSMVNSERERAGQIQKARQLKAEEDLFKEKHNMSEEDFAQFKEKAKDHTMTLEDINYLLNRDQVSANVAQSTKEDMLNQMKNVRNMPTSASGANSQGNKQESIDRQVFNDILGFDNNVDNLFG